MNNKLSEKYKSHDNFIIGRAARKTIRYIEKIQLIFQISIVYLKKEL